MKNQNIRNYAKSKNVYLWEIAMKLNINDGNFSRRLRKQLSDEESSKIMHLIDVISNEKKKEV